MSGRTPRRAQPVGGMRRSLWHGPAEHVLLLACVAALLSLTYLLFVLMSGGLAAPLIAGSALESLRRNLDLARQVFLWSVWAAVVLMSVRYYRAEATGYVTIAAGLALWLLLPLVVRGRAPQTSARELLDLAYLMVSTFETSGAAMVVLGLLRAVVGRIILLSTAPRVGAITRSPAFAAAMAQISEEPVGGRPSLMRKCWELHFCRGSLRVNCPRYLEQVACWKVRSGCYCDQGLATRLLTTMGAKAKVEVAEEMQSVQVRARQEARAAARRARRKARKKGPPCGQCPIYLDHQKFKYRVLSWLSYPVAAAIIGLAISQIRYAYAWVDAYLGEKLALTLPRIPHSQPLQGAEWLSAENLVIVLVGVMVAATILHLTELAVFRLKL